MVEMFNWIVNTPLDSSSGHHFSVRNGLKPAVNYMFKVNNRKTRTRCEICSKLTIKITERAIGVTFCYLY